MNAEKIRNQGDAELRNQERDLMDQLFKLRFQMKMGQSESLNKVRNLKKDVARVKTIMRERALGLNSDAKPAKSEAKAEAKAAAPKKASAAKSTANKSTAAKKTAAKKK